MKFIDKVKIKVRAGKGGDGVVAFRRELYVPKGGPAGGDGGHGGNIIFVGDEGMNTLLALNYQKEIRGENGENGQHKNMHGKNANHTYVPVPLGTLIIDATTNELIGDIVTHRQEVIVAKGGHGGKGNSRFASSRNRAPEIFTRGDLGTERIIICELKLLADVGIIGMPNAGKSTLLSTISEARPQIGDFWFTTLTPQLGVVNWKNDSFVVADLPGLIAGASQGKGLGHEFLRHIERCRLLIHLVDISNPEVYQNYQLVQKELKAYNLALENKSQLIVGSKIDMADASFYLEEFQLAIKQSIIVISAWKREGLDDLLNAILTKLQDLKLVKPIIAQEKVNLYQFAPADETIIIEKSSANAWKVSGKSVYRIYHKFPLTTHANLLIFNKKLQELGVFKELTKKGLKDGDIVKIYDYELQWVDEDLLRKE